MLFSKQLMDKVLDGTKTVTRRLGDKRGNMKVGSFYTATDRSRWAKKGTPYRSCRIEIISNTELPLGLITESDARLEGFKDIDEFKQYWVKHLRFEWNPLMCVWRIEFRRKENEC